MLFVFKPSPPPQYGFEAPPSLNWGLLQMLQSHVGATVGLIYSIPQPAQASDVLRRGSVAGIDLIPSFHVWLVVMEIVRSPYS